MAPARAVDTPTTCFNGRAREPLESVEWTQRWGVSIGQSILALRTTSKGDDSNAAKQRDDGRHRSRRERSEASFQLCSGMRLRGGCRRLCLVTPVAPRLRWEGNLGAPRYDPTNLMYGAFLFGLTGWYRNSIIVHATAQSPFGPYRRKEKLLSYRVEGNWIY